MRVRAIRKGDGAAFLKMQHQLDHESDYMLMLPEERTTTVEEMEQRIEYVLRQHDFLLVALDDDGEIAGYIQAEQGGFKKISHSAYIVVGIQEKLHRKGIGTRFFQSLEKWANEQQITRLELTVITENVGAVSLYKKAGFEIEGTKINAIFQNDVYLDEYYMAKILN